MNINFLHRLQLHHLMSIMAIITLIIKSIIEWKTEKQEV